MSDDVATLPFPSSAPRSASDFFSDPFDSHPLWLKPSLFLSPAFDSETYISELRTFVPFDTLQSELRSNLESLNCELVDLINRDYTDFVNLSTKLVDIDAAVIRMRAPLLELRDKKTGFRGSAEVALFALRSGLHQCSDAATAREVRRREATLQKLRQNAQRRAGAASGVSVQDVSEADKKCMLMMFRSMAETFLRWG